MISFKGRINKKTFLIKSLIIGLIQFLNLVVISYVQRTLASGTDAGTSILSLPISLTSLVISIGVFVFSVSITIKRWHDLGKSGWWTLVAIIPIVNIVVWFYLIFKNGDVGNNNYGSPQQ